MKTKHRKGEQIAIGRRCWTIRMPKGLEIYKYGGCFALLYYLCIKPSELVSGTLLKAGFSICHLSLNFYVGFILHVFCISILFAWHCKLEINLKNTHWDSTDFPRLLFAWEHKDLFIASPLVPSRGGKIPRRLTSGSSFVLRSQFLGMQWLQ